jgi:hypothetical protein
LLIDFHRLLAAAILAAQPKREAGGVQIMFRSVEVDSPEFLRPGRTAAEVAGRKPVGEPIHVGLAQFDPALQFLHEASPDKSVSPFPHARIHLTTPDGLSQFSSPPKV